MTRWHSLSTQACLRFGGLTVAFAAILVGALAVPLHGAESPVAPVEVPASVLAAEEARIAAIEKATKSAVAIFADGGNNGGSGVVISADGYALTNFHVVKPAGSHMKCGMSDGKLYDAVIVGIDPTGDVALIKLLGREDFTPAVLADSDRVQVGDWCFAVGNPFLLATDFQPTVSYGIVSGTHRYQYPAGTLLEYADCLQTDAAINPGNSGGPLFNANGDLIGINGRGSFEKRGRVNVGVGYAISINQIKYFLGCLKSGRIVDHATLGANVATNEDGRVMVSNILESSDAYHRGLRYADEIIAFGGREISTTNEFKNVLGIYPKGWRVPLTYRRDGKKYEISVRLTGVHAEEELIGLLRDAPEPESPQPSPKPEKDSKESPGKPGEPKPMPQRRPGPVAGKPKVQVPPEIAKLIEARSGFANYYFNRLHQERVQKSASAGADFSPFTGEWVFQGELAGGGKVEIKLADSASHGEFPTGKADIDGQLDLDRQLGPTGSGGLLLALHLWRRMLVAGPSAFGSTVYYGTAPHPAIQGTGDVLSSTINVVETNFIYDPETGRLAALELFPSDEDDVCEVRFLDYETRQGVLVPLRMEVRHGDTIVADLKWQEVSFASSTEK